MSKILFVDCEKCTLCGLCVMACSFKHEGEFNPLKARITVDRVIAEGLMVPNVCWQCESPAPCEEDCPVEAISRNEETGALIIDHDECTNCETCIESCPYDNIKIDPDSDRIIKCDLCDGDPECVKYCAYDTLTLLEASDETLSRKESERDRIANLLAA